MARAPKERQKSGAAPSRKKPRTPSPAKRTLRRSLGAILKDFCRTLPGTTEDVKWEDHLMFSVGKKIYAGFDVEDTDSFGIKCDDIDFERLTKIDGIIPAPYAARFGWVKFTRGDVMPLAKVKALILKSHALVMAGLSRKVRLEIVARA